MGDAAVKVPMETLAESMEKALIEGREARVEQARTLNLLSNVFMSVALDDKAACQYVLRILLGIPDLVVKEVRAQDRISKVTSHAAEQSNHNAQYQRQYDVYL